MINVNLFGVIYGLRAFLPQMRANDVGHIVNTASVSGLYHLRRMGPYNATKAAIVALSETLKFELDAEGSHVGVSVLCPSWCARTSRPLTATFPSGSPTSSRPSRWSSSSSTRRSGASARHARDQPSAVADQVCAAVKENRFYVITHPESVAVFAERAARIVAGENPIEPPQ